MVKTTHQLLHFINQYPPQQLRHTGRSPRTSQRDLRSSFLPWREKASLTHTTLLNCVRKLSDLPGRRI